jgi:hypothetical protein
MMILEKIQPLCRGDGHLMQIENLRMTSPSGA